MNLRRSFKALVLVVALCVLTTAGVTAQASEINMRYVSTNKVFMELSFENNQASCAVSVFGKSGTEKITGTVKLYDDTSRKTVKSWSVSKEGSIASSSKTVSVTSGHSYTLSFSGYVYDEDGDAEYVYDSESAKN